MNSTPRWIFLGCLVGLLIVNLEYMRRVNDKLNEVKCTTDNLLNYQENPSAARAYVDSVKKKQEPQK